MVSVNLGAGFWRRPGWINVNYLSQHYDSYGIEKFHEFTDVEYNLTSMEPLPFSDEYVDGFFCCMVFEHLENRHVNYVLRECYRCLKPGGSMLVVVPIPLHDIRQFIRRLSMLQWGLSYNHELNGRHINFYPPGKLKKMLIGAGFDRVEKLGVEDVESCFRSHVRLAQYVKGYRLKGVRID